MPCGFSWLSHADAIRHLLLDFSHCRKDIGCSFIEASFPFKNIFAMMPDFRGFPFRSGNGSWAKIRFWKTRSLFLDIHHSGDSISTFLLCTLHSIEEEPPHGGII